MSPSPERNVSAESTRSKMTETTPTQYENTLKEKAPHLLDQLNEYFSLLGPKLHERVRDSRRIERGMKHSKNYLSWKLVTRIDRADDLTKVGAENKGIVDEARELARQYIGEGKHHFFVTCIDGRNLPVIMLSHVPHFGGAIRTQAGELLGFKESIKTESVVLDPTSFEAQAITKLVVDRPGENVHYSLDSHFGCAARGRLHKGEGGKEKDGGLLSDIQRKLKIAEGILQLVANLKNKGFEVANIIPQLFSYDPHDGTLYMGLEIHADALNGTDGFTPEVLENLVQHGMVISTWGLLKNPEVKELLEAANIPLVNMRENFAESLLSNWKAIHSLYQDGTGRVYQIIYDALTNAYNKGGFAIGDVDNLSQRKISRLALENKAKVMMKNLVTRWSIARDDHEWPFSEHLEQGVVITEGGFGPFNSKDGDIHPDTFAVFSKEDLPALLEHVKLAIRDLIRPFRQAGRIKDPVQMLEGEDFVEAPVVVMNHAVLRTIRPEIWEQLRDVDFIKLFSEIDWDDPNTLYTWGRTQIKSMLKRVLEDKNIEFTFKESSDLIDGFWELFQRTQFMMNDPEFREWVASGRVLMMNKLVDYDRRPQILAPMLF